MNTFAAFPCPHCQNPMSKIMHAQFREGAYRRRRLCLRCNKGFITYERPAKLQPRTYSVKESTQ